MSARPVRRHSPAVYRRRRLAVLIVALVVIAGLVWLFVAQPWRGSADSAPRPAASPSAPVEPSPEASETPTLEQTPENTSAPASTSPVPDEAPIADACQAGDIVVEAATDGAVYAAGQNPQLSIRLTNRSDADCIMNVGTSAQAFTVTSGSDVWWRSTDCQSEPSDMVVVLAAGQEVSSSTPLAWDRTRSSVDTCQGERESAPGDGATYRLSVAIGGIASTNTATFQLT